MLVNKVMVVLFLFFGFLFLARLVGKEFDLSAEGYDERQKIYRDRGYKWGFYAILLLLFISIFASEELMPYLTIETLSLLILSAGVFTTMAYWIWTDAYFKPKNKGILSGAFFFLLQADNLFDSSIHIQIDFIGNLCLTPPRLRYFPLLCQTFIFLYKRL